LDLNLGLNDTRKLDIRFHIRH